MSNQDSTVLPKTLDELLRSRFHGAKSIAGIRFQLLYSLLRTFDLYTTPSATEVQFEGLEDVDLKGLRIEDHHFQVKSSQSKQGWGWLNKERILDHFIEVYQLDPEACFVVVTNFDFKGQLRDLARFCNSELAELPQGVRKKMNTIAQRSGLDKSDVVKFLRRVSFEHTTEQEMLDQLRAACLRHFQLDAGNESLYLSRLIDCVVTWSATRAVINKQHLEAEKSCVQDWIGLGVENPAVRDRLIKPLSFVEEETTEDYYEGKKARPGHILAGLDAPRPMWQRKIEDTLQRVKVGIIKASSGQGKSTLLYRYAFNHFVPDTIYRLQVCAREEHVGQVADYLRSRLTLGLPLLVLIDNLNYSTRLWHRVAAELAGADIRFLVTTREEDWYRYGLGTSGFVWDFVQPHLSLEEAQFIFQYFQQRDRIAGNVPSTEWAYEQVANKRLLIEFVYLITHGQMLAERIEEQIKTIEGQGEDPAKLEVLRLVATAQVYGARVSIQSLLQSIEFRSDPQSTLKSLEREYIECYDGECEGLHFVRSDHLVEALHTPLPIEHTVARLLRLLDQENLVALVSSVFADPSINPDDMLLALSERCQDAPLSLITTIVEALFAASEALYFQAHKHLFDAAVEQVGPSAVILLATSTAPSGNLETLQELAELFPGHPNIQLLNEIVPQFRSRLEAGSQRIPRAFLEHVVERLQLDDTTFLTHIAVLSEWCRFFGVSAPAVDEFLESSHWEAILQQANGEDMSPFLYALYQRLPHRYQGFVDAQRGQLFNQFKQWFETLSIEEQNSDIEIEFIVDETVEDKTPNNQAVERLEHLYQWFPIYDHYRSQGLYPSTGGQTPEVDDSHKRIPRSHMSLGLHAPKNAIYLRLVEEHYAPRLAFEWAQHWHDLRSKTLEFVRNLISIYRGVYRGQKPNTHQLHPVASDLTFLYQQAPRLPARLASRFDKQQKAIQSWCSSMHVFLQQYYQHAPTDSKDRQAFLMRHNLKDSIKQLPAMHQAFAEIFQAEIDHFNMAALDSQELVIYSYLADILDYWFDGHRRQVRNLRAAIRRWQEAQTRSFVTEIRDTLAPLDKAGMEFMYPTGPLYDHPLIGLCLGYGVLDFEQQEEQVGLIAVAIASIELTYNFLYLVQTVHGHQYSPVVTRVGRDTLRRLVAEEEVEGGVYPVQPPDGLYTVLPDLNPTLLPDTALVYRLREIQAHLVMERNRLYFARSRLDTNVTEEANLLHYYESSVRASLEEILAVFDELQAEALAYSDTASAHQEWLSLWEQGAVLIKNLADFSNVDTTHTPQSVWQQSAIDPLFARYMNRKYLEL